MEGAARRKHALQRLNVRLLTPPDTHTYTTDANTSTSTDAKPARINQARPSSHTDTTSTRTFSQPRVRAAASTDLHTKTKANIPATTRTLQATIPRHTSTRPREDKHTHTAADSHIQNAAYMGEFREGLRALGMDGGHKDACLSSSMRSNVLSSSINVPACGDAFTIADVTMWRGGPVDAAGVLWDLSDRPIICGSLSSSGFAVGSADHAVYVIHDDPRRSPRKLYTKTHGHSEWVTSVEHPRGCDGSLLSGGMDGRLCMWSSTGTRCKQLQAHTTTISKLLVDANSPVALSADYAGKVKLWDLRTFSDRSTPSAEYSCGDATSPAPVLDAAYCCNTLLAACRDGNVFSFDLISGEYTLTRAHKGHATCVGVCGPRMFISGGADGMVKVTDLRAPDTAVVRIRAHCTPAGAGAVGGLLHAYGDINSGPGPGLHLVSYGADRSICVMDVRGGAGNGEVTHRLTTHREFIYCMTIAREDELGLRDGPLVFSGGGDGLVLCHDLKQGRVLFGLGACERGAVRCIRGAEGRLFVGNDSGDVLRYEFAS